MKKRILSMLLTIVLVVGLLPMSVFAADNSTTLIITGGTEGADYTYENGVLEIKKAGTYEIKNADPATETDDIIKVSAPSGTVNITLGGVNIVTTEGMSVPAFEIIGDCTTNITLADNTKNILNSWESKDGIFRNYAGLQNGEKHLSISCKHSEEAEHSCDNTCGSLEAVGGNYAACIGGGYNISGKNITIHGGNITADFSGNQKGSAGIGGGAGGDGSNITISGGTVTAAGIGGGNGGSGSNITISGGTVTAAGGFGAGIGGGNGGSGSNITISGGTVTAAGGFGAGIGGGNGGSGSNITISGGTVTATSADGAGIGGGDGGDGSNITISGGIVIATGEDAGIGGDDKGSCSNVTISGGVVTATSTLGGGIGHGANGGIAENIIIAPAANTKVYAYNGSDNTGAALDGSPFTTATNVTNILSGNAFYSYAEHVHSFSSDWTYDENHHWHAATCGHEVSSDTAAHSGGTATCTEKAVCESCAQPYGATLGHDWGDWISNNDGTHTRTCANDTSHTETNACSGGTATCTEKATCDVCAAEYGDLAAHSFSSDWTYDENNHWHAAICGHEVTSDTAEHSYGSDRTCDTCGYTKPAPYVPPSAPTYPPVVDSGDNGDVTVTPRYPEQGDTVVITPEPDKGYEVDEIIVTDRNGESITVTDKGDGTYRFKQPYGKVTITVTFKKEVCSGGVDCPIDSFTDLDSGAWYHEAVDYALENGLMNGVGGDQFAPGGTTSRAMVWTILARLDGVDTDGEVWYEAGQKWAMENGISDGTMANDAITREQFATILWRYAKYKGYDVSVGEDTNILSYEDAFSISEYAIPAMQWACGAGLIQGDGVNLTPKADATRTQAAALFQRFCENVAAK